MRHRFAAAGMALLLAGPATAADEPAATGAPTPLLPPALVQPLPPPPAEQPQGAPAVPEPAPVAPTPVPAPSQAAPAVPEPAPVPAAPAPAPAVEPVPQAPVAQPVAAMPAAFGLPFWAAGLLVAVGGLVAGLVGAVLAGWHRRRDQAERRRAAASVLSLELESRRLAFEAVPVPPNAEAGVSFVSAVLALADLDGGWRAMQGSVHLLPEKYAAQVASHYAAVHHTAAFIKGQSLAAAVRMLQANRIGGHPAPDAGLMREAHVELASAFRGVDKLVQGLRSIL